MTYFAKSLIAAALCLVFAGSALAADAAHKLALHVDQNDPAVMNLVLNNAKNVQSYYADKGETVAIEIVAYGPGLKMYTADSPVKDRISAMSLEHENLTFAACGNTLAAMEKKAGAKVELISEASMVPSGVVRLIELQEQGYSYVRP
jgi:hypothetical protein